MFGSRRAMRLAPLIASTLSSRHITGTGKKAPLVSVIFSAAPMASATLMNPGSGLK